MQRQSLFLCPHSSAAGKCCAGLFETGLQASVKYSDAGLFRCGKTDGLWKQVWMSIGYCPAVQFALSLPLKRGCFVYPRLDLNSQSYFLNLSAGITGICHYTGPPEYYNFCWQ